MRTGVALSGLIGVGKSTVEALLRERLQLRTPNTLVTRPVESGELSSYVHLSHEEFLRRARAKEIALPLQFAGTWYGYEAADWREAIASGGRGWLFNVRPYLGLILGSLMSDMRLFWLEVPEDVRLVRLRGRRAERDRNAVRAAKDREDLVYRELYDFIISSEDAEACVERIQAHL